MNAIEIHDLKKVYYDKRKHKNVEAVKGISLSVNYGEIFGFLGPNGAGKTTSLRMLTTLLPIDEGEAKISGYDVKRNSKEVRRHIGYVGQLGGTDMEATGRENLMLSGFLYGMSKAAIQKQMDYLLDLLDLNEIIDRVASTYSGGQRRRLEIGLGILHKPNILFLDEPTTGLDPQNRANLWEHIRKLKAAGMTVFLTTHYLEEADELCDRLCIMDKGIIITEGTPAMLKKEISGDVVTIKIKNHVRSITHLFNGDANVLSIRAAGEKINLYVKNGMVALPKIVDTLTVNNLELESISLSQPTLNDVFLEKTGRALRDIGKDSI